MHQERRDSRRFEPQLGRDEAKLRHKGKTDVALVLDISAEGFRLCLHSGKTLAVGEVVTLETCDGKHIARVIHLEDDKTSGRMILGLERLSDVPLSDSQGSLREQIRRRDKFENDRLIDMGPIFAYVMLPLAVGLSILQLVVGPDGLQDISRMITRQLGL